MKETSKEAYLAQWCKDIEAGQFLVFSEYRDGHGGGTATVVDLVTVSDGHEEQEGDVLGLYRSVAGWCDSTLYDEIVDFEVWPNGEVYLDGDGINHPRYRVTGLLPVSAATTLDASDDLTDMQGFPVWWTLEQFDQASWPDKAGTKVEMGIWYHLASVCPGWEFRKGFAQNAQGAVDLVMAAMKEFAKPKYGQIQRAIKVDGKVVWSQFAEHMPEGHELV